MSKGNRLVIDYREIRAFYAEKGELTDDQCEEILQLFCDEFYPDAIASAVEQVLQEIVES